MPDIAVLEYIGFALHSRPGLYMTEHVIHRLCFQCNLHHHQDASFWASALGQSQLQLNACMPGPLCKSRYRVLRRTSKFTSNSKLLSMAQNCSTVVPYWAACEGKSHKSLPVQQQQYRQQCQHAINGKQASTLRHTCMPVLEPFHLQWQPHSSAVSQSAAPEAFGLLPGWPETPGSAVSVLHC